MMRHSRRYSVTTDPRLIWDRLSIDYREKGRPNIKYLYLYLDLYSQLPYTVYHSQLIILLELPEDNNVISTFVLV
jgi:hypothetical protein